MMKMAIIAAMVAGIMLCFLISCAPATDSRACQFTGTVGLQGAKVPDGTIITAVIDGDEYSTMTPTIYGSSCYSLMIEPPEGRSYPDGAEVIFKIDGQTALQTGVFTAGSNVGLDLTTYNSVPEHTVNLWAVITASIGLFICIGVICFLLHLDRLLKKMSTPVTGDYSPPESSTAVIELYLE